VEIQALDSSLETGGDLALLWPGKAVLHLWQGGGRRCFVQLI